MEVNGLIDNNDRISTKVISKMLDIKTQLPDALITLAITPYSGLHGNSPDALSNDLRTRTYCLV